MTTPIPVTGAAGRVGAIGRGARPLERAGEAYARMMSGDAQFRGVLTM